MWFWANWIFYFLMTTMSLAEDPTVLVADRIVVVIGRQIITLSDIRLEKKMAKWSPSIFAPFQERRKEPVRFLLEIQLLRQRAGQVLLYQPKPKEVEKRLKELTDKWEEEVKNKDKIFHSIDKNRLRVMLSTIMIAEQYAQRNLGTSQKDTKKNLRNRYNRWINGISQEAKKKGRFHFVEQQYDLIPK